MDCGTCTLCCKLPEMPWVKSRAGEWCSECDQKKGCKIWGEHPKECQEYFCMWVQQEEASMDLRPDNCGIIFDKISDNIIMGKIDTEVKELNQVVLNQIKQFTEEGFSVVMTQKDIGKPYIYGGKGADEEEVWNEVLKIREEWLRTLQTYQQ